MKYTHEYEDVTGFTKQENGLKMSKSQETADAQRAEAKSLLCEELGLPGNIMSGAIDRAVDCIIGAAVLEAVMVINQGMQEHALNRATSDNP